MLTKRDVEKIRLSMANELNASSRTPLVCMLLLLLLFGLVCFDTANVDLTTAVSTARTR
jgi:hypothetical protein